MAGSNPDAMMPDDLDRQLADALRTEPSAEFRARIRARVASERMNPGWRLPLPAVAYASLAGVVVAAIWFTSFGESPIRQVLDEASSVRPPIYPSATGSTGQVRHPTRPELDRHRPVRDVLHSPAVARSTTPGAPTAEPPAASANEGQVGRAPEVLLSQSERAGVQLFLESAASGRLRLPEDMLRDLSLPIVEARTIFPDPDLPWVTVEGAVQ